MTVMVELDPKTSTSGSGGFIQPPITNVNWCLM